MPAGGATRDVYGKIGGRGGGNTLGEDNLAKTRNGCSLQIQFIQGLQPLNYNCS